MKKFDVFLVRVLPIIMFLYIISVTINAWRGQYNVLSEYLMGNSFIYALTLFFISLSDRKYHCVWNRAMYIELMVVPLINYTDAKWDIFADSISMLMFISFTLILTLIATIILAVRHFIITRKRKRETNGNN